MASRRRIALIWLCSLLLASMLLVACGSEEGTDASVGPVGASGESDTPDLVGDSVFFGRYEQDADLDNGQEPIEWDVLDVCDGRVLLLSRYGLTAMPFNTEETDVTWETCSLRAWLNDDFLNDAFTAEEVSAIFVTEVDNGADQGYVEWNAPAGNTTQDRVFLLSYAEANRYLGVTYRGDGAMARVAPSEYMLATGVYTYSGTETVYGEAAGDWWLRSPSFVGGASAAVDHHGSLYGNFSVLSDAVCVRPAIWVDLYSDVIDFGEI